MPRLVLLRHGQSIWNRDNLFTGWTDVPLSEAGVAEAERAGRRLVDDGFQFDVCFTSYLRRAIHTLHIALDVMDQLWLPVEKSWRLNERHYGSLQGLHKDQMREMAGKEQVHAWRRSFSVRPPALDVDDPRFPGHDRRYTALSDDEMPRTESLEDTVKRTLPYWDEAIAPALGAGRDVLISAHGNSLRGLVKYLESISDDDIPGLEIPTGEPWIYDLDDAMRATGRRILEAASS
jgi:2,3-bisphosphoglycerate-dependent phosphoglycerate mutase